MKQLLKKEIYERFGQLYNSEGEPIFLTDELPMFVTFINPENRGEECEKCKSKNNPVWYTDNDFWKDIIERDGCFCLYCFMNMAHDKKDIIRWKIIADTNYDK